MDDTQRLDSLAEYGLCVSQHSLLQNDQWTERWVCHFGIGESLEGETIREVIDAAVELINSR